MHPHYGDMCFFFHFLVSNDKNRKIPQQCGFNSGKQFPPYLKHLSEQGFIRKHAEKEKADKDKAQREQVAAIKEKEKSCEIENETKFLKTAISDADKSVTEGNLYFQACMKCTSLIRKKLEQAQTRIDMSLKLKVALELDLTNLENRKIILKSQLIVFELNSS